MDLAIKKSFLETWGARFPGAELPLALWYADDPGRAEAVPEPDGWRCLVAQLAAARAGRALAFGAGSITCGGGSRYLGFAKGLRPNFEYFLSCGIPGRMDGERYKKGPELVREMLEKDPGFDAPARYAVFARFDLLEQGDSPDVVVFFASPDTLSGVFTLSGFDEPGDDSVIAPFSAGCGSIVKHPYRELASGRCRSVLGMFDVSARPYVPADVLTFAVPWPRFARMVANAPESFLSTEAWAKVSKRMGRG